MAVRFFARVGIWLVAAASVVATAPGTASACSCAPVTTAEAVERAHTVFVGEEIARQPIDRDSGRIEWVSHEVTFRVIEAYKGNVSDTMIVYTGSGGGDCGVGSLSGVVGITIGGAGEPTINICGSIHAPHEIAQLLTPIDLVNPETPPPTPGSGGVGPGLFVAALGALVAAGIGIAAAVRRRRDDWHDGWSSAAP